MTNSFEKSNLPAHFSKRYNFALHSFMNEKKSKCAVNVVNYKNYADNLLA